MKDDQNLPPSPDCLAESTGAGAGARSLAGYDYQIDVSIWLALDLMLGSDLTQMVELEPASEEDLEAQLADDEPGRVTTCVGLDSYTLVVQIKLRDGDAWTISGINRLLEHGSPTRPSAARRLAANSAVRYLLVTSATLNGEAKKLRVKYAGSWPQKDSFPASTAKRLTASLAGRIAVIDNLDEERLVQDIKRILIERFGVPYSRWIECLRTLRSEARLRLRRVNEGQWRKDELSHVIRNHDGYLARSAELDGYVYPQNWQDLRKAMGTPKYAAIIIGKSGTGKTLATRVLYEELRKEIPGLAHVPIRQGPQQLRDDRTPPPVLYDIEDPWGRYDFNPESRPWNDELSRCMSSARADKLIIATSRLDVAEASGARDSVKRWIVPLEAEEYGQPQRQQLYRNRIKALPRDIQLLASDSAQQVLDKLDTPLEFDKFFDALRTMERPHKNLEQRFISTAIAKAHEQTIEQTVIQQIEQRDDVCAAAVIWAFLKASDRLSLKALRNLEMALAEQLVAFDKGVVPLIDFFVAARNLRLNAGNVSYYHPRVEAGLEKALKRQPVRASRALCTLLDVLADPKESGASGGVAIATRVAAAAKQLPELTVAPKIKAARRIDSWLSDCLAESSSNLRENLNLAAAAGSPDSNVAEFARYLLHQSNHPFAGFDFWERPDHSDAWYKGLHADPEIAALACRFIREILPNAFIHYDEKFIDDLERLIPDLTPAFIDAATTIVGYGCMSSLEVITIGALRDLDGFEPVLDKAIEILTPSEEKQARSHEIKLAIINDVYNSDYAEYLEQNDEGYTAWEFLESYADRVREVKGWRSLIHHRHAERLLSHWMHSLKKIAKLKPISADEIAGAFTAAFNSKEESVLWYVLTQQWDQQYQTKLHLRIHEGSQQSDVRQAALACLIKHLPCSLTAIIQDLRKAGRDERTVELMIDLAYLRDKRAGDGDEHEVAATAAMNLLEPELRELCDVASLYPEREQWPLSRAAAALLGTPACSSMSVRSLRIRRYSDLPDSVPADIKWTLANKDDRDDCLMALEAAIGLGLDDVIAGALDHRFSHVVAKALTTLGEKAAAPLPPDWLALANAEGSPVRKALVELISSKPHPDHLPTLLHLVQDQWAASSRYYGEDDVFPIARSAVYAISKLDQLDPAMIEQLQKIALETSDWVVCKGLFAIIAVQGGVTYQQQLIELAVTPGRIGVRIAAAYALLAGAKILDITVVDKITADVLLDISPKIAAILTLTVACQAPPDRCKKIACAIAASPKRRGLLLLMLWATKDTDEAFTSTVEQLLPSGHLSVAWVNAGPTERVEDDFIDDLGDPAICREILRWLNPKPL